MGLKEFLEKLRNRKEKYNAYAEDRKIVEKYEEKLKSSNERELERFMKEEREDHIKRELEEFRKKRQVEAQYGNQIIKVKNMFAPEQNKVSILKNDNLFVNNKNLFANEKRVFFK